MIRSIFSVFCHQQANVFHLVWGNVNRASILFLQALKSLIKMSLLSKGRVVSSHIFIILLNKWIYPAHKLANTFSPCSTCWHFPADGLAEGEAWKVISDKGQDVWSLSLTTQRHWPACSSHPASALFGRARLCDCRHHWEGHRGNRKKSNLPDLVELISCSFALKLFESLWVEQSICVFVYVFVYLCVRACMLYFYLASFSSNGWSSDDLIWNSWGIAIWPECAQISVLGKLESGFRENRWVKRGWSLKNMWCRAKCIPKPGELFWSTN